MAVAQASSYSFIQPLAWKFPYVAGVVLKKEREEELGVPVVAQLVKKSAPSL